MQDLIFKKAERKGILLRKAIDGPTGSGKTYSALAVAMGMLRPGQRVALIDTERSSANRYADEFDFDQLNLPDHSPDTYIRALKAVDPEKYGVTIVDSLSHAWMGKDGALEQVDKAAARQQSKNTFTAWRDVTPMHNRLVDALLSHNTHLIVTMRSKMAYELVENERGKKEPVRLGLAPVQREGVEYEFDIIGDMNGENKMVISKTRAKFLRGAVIDRPDASLGKSLAAWCGDIDRDDLTVSESELRMLLEKVDAGLILAKASDLFQKNPKQLTVGEFNMVCKELLG